MPWIALLLAGICEIGWAIGMKMSDGFTRLVPSLVTAALMLVSFGLLAWALRMIPLGTAYAVWTGIGALGTAVVGIVYFNEPRDFIRILSLSLILLGILGLKFGSSAA